MAKYTFKCSFCQNSFQEYTNKDDKERKCNICGNIAKRLCPILKGIKVTESIDKDQGVEWIKDQEELIDERNQDHYWSVLVPRFVQQYSLEMCLSKGWVYYDDKGILQMRTKPPQKE